MATKTKVTIGLTVAVLGAAIVYAILRFSPSSDEEGIRVKHGSVDLETASKEGFAVDTADPSKKFKLKRDAKGNVHIAVFDGICQDAFFVANAHQVSIETAHNNVAGKATLVAKGALVLSDFKDKGNLTQLTLDGTLTAIEVFDSAGKSELRCEKAPGKYLQAYLHISKK